MPAYSFPWTFCFYTPADCQLQIETCLECRPPKCLPYYVGNRYVRPANRNQNRQKICNQIPHRYAQGWIYHVSVQYVPAALPKPGKRRRARKAGKKNAAAQRPCGYFGDYRQAIRHDGNIPRQRNR